MHRAAAQAGGIGMPKRKTSRQWCDWGRLQPGMDRQPGRLAEQGQAVAIARARLGFYKEMGGFVMAAVLLGP